MLRSIHLLLLASIAINYAHARIRGFPVPKDFFDVDADADVDLNFDTNHDRDHAHAHAPLTASSTIPSLRDTLELGHLSSMVYSFRHFHKSAANCSIFPLIYQEYIENVQPPVFIENNATFTCHMYERDEQDTQVLIISKESINNPSLKDKNNQDNNIFKGDGDDHEHSHKKGYIAVVYAGTDDFRNMMTDMNERTTPFGPTSKDGNGTHPLSPSDSVRVHAGFNNAVFRNGLYDRIHTMVNKIKQQNPDYRLMTTGHSLGAADAVLTAVGLKLSDESWANELVLSVNFGCPKTGNRAWRDYVNGMDGVGVWRVVNGIDLVPRMPGPTFHHVGHTLQFNRDAARAFWLHNGDQGLGYRGVPFGWNSEPYALAPAAAVYHLIGKYIKYLDTRCVKDKVYYIDGFERINDHHDSDDGGVDPDPEFVDDDDIWSTIPDDEIFIDEEEIIEREIIDICAIEYLRMVCGVDNDDITTDLNCWNMRRILVIEMCIMMAWLLSLNRSTSTWCGMHA